LSGVFITKNIVPHLALLHFFRRVEYISLFFVAYFSFKKIKDLKIFAVSVFVSTLGVIIYGLGQKFYGWPVVSTMNNEFSRGMILKLTWWARVNSTFAGHYDLAAFMVMMIPLIIVSIMLARKLWLKLTLGVLGILSYYILILTASRVSFGAYLLGTSLVFLLSKKKWLVVPFLIFSFLGMFFSADLGQRYAATFKIDLSFLSGLVKVPEKEIALAPTLTPTLVPTEAPVVKVAPVVSEVIPTSTPTPTPTPIPVATSSGEPIESTALAVSRSTDIRLKVEWPRAIRAFAKNPLLGTGYSSITLATDNDYLRSLGEAGLLGSLALLAVFLEIGRCFFSFLRKKEVSPESRLVILGIAASAFGYFLNATFIDVFEASKIAFFFWILMGVGLRVIDLNKSRNESS
ncbi:MAG: hypothetical protein M1514_03685, partial [Patescibacteria group bacterium]|nr:hypothetical protein [Patescibacteria group bacterium]